MQFVKLSLVKLRKTWSTL